MAYTKEMTTSEILLRLASMRNELLQAVNDIEKISKNIYYKAEQTEPEIVRCGECKHLTADGRCLEFADDNIRPSANDFCSYGEKKQ